jgi:hypothetical protein
MIELAIDALFVNEQQEISKEAPLAQCTSPYAVLALVGSPEDDIPVNVQLETIVERVVISIACPYLARSVPQNMLSDITPLRVL